MSSNIVHDRNSRFKTILLAFIVLLLPGSVISENIKQPITCLSSALARVKQHNSDLKSRSSRIAAANSRLNQAQRLPNPELGIEIENFAGDADGFNESETSVSISQPIELGDKRLAKTNFARIEKDIVTQRARIRDLDIKFHAAQSFKKLLYTQNLIELINEQLTLAGKVVSQIRRKHEAGAVLQIEKTKAKIAQQNLELSLQAATIDENIAKQTLSALWGGTSSDIGKLEGSLNPTDGKFHLNNFDLSNSPHAILAELLETSSRKHYELLRSEATPDVSLGFGYRRLEETETNTFLGMVSVELPLFDNNADGILAAKQEVEVASLEKEGTLRKLNVQLQNLRSSLRSLLTQQQKISSQIIPSNETAYIQARNAYKQGRVSYLELLDSGNALFQAKKMHLATQLSLSVTVLRIQNLIGQQTEDKEQNEN